MEKQQKLKELGAVSSFAIYISAAILLYLGTHFFIPYLSKATGQETILCWFIVAGLGVFTPFILIGIFILKKEGYSLSKSTYSERLRFRKLSKRDVMYSIVGLIIVGLLSGLILKVMEMFIGNVNTTPSFMSFEPLSSGRYWLLLVWLPYWFLNILGEEFLWRGIMLPRQEIAFGKYTWLVHGFGWGIFHFAFGWQMLLTLFPILFIQPYLVQKCKNSWIGVIIHGGLNGPSFIAICFGLIQ